MNYHVLKTVYACSLLTCFSLLYSAASEHPAHATGTGLTVEHSSSKKNKKRPKKSDSPKKKSSFRNMTFEELKEETTRFIQAKNNEAAIRYSEKMLPLCNDPEVLEEIMLQLADLHYQDKSYTKASKAYEEYTQLYPSSKNVEYAYYRAIECSFVQLPEADRDQTKTKETIDLIKKFLERSTVFTTYLSQVQDMYTKCNERLLASEINIFSFYLNRGSITAAQKRAEGLRSFIPLLPKAEAQILVLEWDIAQHQNNLQLVEQKKAELTDKFPDFAQEIIASKQPTRTLAQRF